MTYEERAEQAISANDVDALAKYIGGYPLQQDKGRTALRLQNAG